MYIYTPFFLDRPLGSPIPSVWIRTEHRTELHVPTAGSLELPILPVVVCICQSQAPGISLLYRLVYCQTLLVRGFPVSERIRLLESTDSKFSCLPTRKEGKLRCRGEGLSHLPTILFACRTFPLLFPHLSSASADRRPSATWPCLPAYSSSFILITTSSPKSGFYSGKNTVKFEEMPYSFILGPWLVFFLGLFVFWVSRTIFHYIHLTSLWTLVISFLSRGGGGGCFTGTSQAQFKCCSQLLPYDPNTPRGGTY